MRSRVYWASQLPGLSASHHQVTDTRDPTRATKPSARSASHGEGSSFCPRPRSCRLELTVNWPASPPFTPSSYLHGGLRGAWAQVQIQLIASQYSVGSAACRPTGRAAPGNTQELICEAR